MRDEAPVDMELTRSVIETKADEYAAEEPLYAVESEQVDGLPDAFATGDFGWRDAEWVVQWYYRRFLGAYPNARRRAVEDAYGENDYEAVRDALADASVADDTLTGLERLTSLSGVDVKVGSGFLMFLDPEANIVVGDREWTVLREADELDAPVPEPISAEDYRGYLESCQAIGEQFECSMWTLYRALWRLWKDEFE